MFRSVRFDVQIERNVTGDRLIWPKGTQVESDSGLGCNREYCDLRGISWAEAREIHAWESELIRQIEDGSQPGEGFSSMEEKLAYSDELLMGLDIGVASTVAALSAARCVPVTSCNGGAFGTRHHEDHPLVLFSARSQQVELLLQAAEQAGAGLVNAPSGYLLVYANDIKQMMDLAWGLISMRGKFRRLRLRIGEQMEPDQPGIQSSQLKLFE
jgi:hypothetical protein